MTDDDPLSPHRPPEAAAASGPAGLDPGPGPGGGADRARGSADGRSLGARRWPWWLRAVGFGVTVAIMVLATVAVVSQQSGRADRAASAAATVRTVPVPAEIVSTTTSAAPPALPPGGTTVPPSRAGVGTDQVATALEALVPVETGWTHAVNCGPPRPIAAHDVLECEAHTEPPIDDVDPSTVLVVVLDDAGHFTWQRATSGPVTLAALAVDAQSCTDLVAQNWPYVSTLAWWQLHGRPAAFDPDGTGRPCSSYYPPAEVDRAFAKAVQA